MQSPQPAGMCETELKVSVDGVTQWNPDITVSVRTNGDTVLLGLLLGIAVSLKLQTPPGWVNNNLLWQ